MNAKKMMPLFLSVVFTLYTQGLTADTRNYTFNNVYPGTYYLYSYNYINKDKRHLSDDYMSSNVNIVFTLQANR
jgi:hypothetical protein